MPTPDVITLSRIMTPANFYWQGEGQVETVAWLEEKIKSLNECRVRFSPPLFLNDVLDHIGFPSIPGGYDFGWDNKTPIKMDVLSSDSDVGTILIRMEANRIND